MSTGYIGKAGQMYVMAEFLERGWNVAIPEVDVGDDIFVVRDDDGHFSRIQVKTHRVDSRDTASFDAAFFIQRSNLVEERQPGLYFVFVVRRPDHWMREVVISRERLYEYENTDQLRVEQLSDRRLRLEISFEDRPHVEVSSGVDLTEYRDNFAPWERISH